MTSAVVDTVLELRRDLARLDAAIDALDTRCWSKVHVNEWADLHQHVERALNVLTEARDACASTLTGFEMAAVAETRPTKKKARKR